MECNNYRFGRRKVSEQGREINKMLDLMNIDNIGFGYFRANASQQVSTRIRQPTHHLPARPSRVLFLVIYPGKALAKVWRDRKSTRLNSSHSQISYAVFCLKKNTAREFRPRLLGLSPVY